MSDTYRPERKRSDILSLSWWTRTIAFPYSGTIPPNPPSHTLSFSKLQGLTESKIPVVGVLTIGERRRDSSVKFHVSMYDSWVTRV